MSTATATQRAPWSVDPAHTELGFSVKHMMVANVRGSFKDFEVHVDLNDDDITQSQVRVDIDVASIESRVSGRDDHLRSADFFDAANHPKMTFVSERIQKVSDEQYRIIGNLTIRGTTKPVVLEAELNGPSRDPWGNDRIGVSAHTKIDRRDWGLTWNAALETGGFAVAHDVKISVETQLVRPA